MKLLVATVIFCSLPAFTASATTYYLSPTGDDLNNGITLQTPWLSMNHAVSCGDVIQAAASDSYVGWNFDFNWGTVSNCPSPSGSEVAWLQCITFDACKVIEDSTGAVAVDHSNWGVQGFEVRASVGSQDIGCFTAIPNYTTPVTIHHIIFANDVANGCQNGGFGSANHGTSAGVDYLAIVGNIAYNAAQGNGACYSGISIYQPVQSDSLPGTHLFVAGNFSYGNFNPVHCPGSSGTPSDGEGIIFDTFDGDQGGLTPYRAQAVADNNIVVANGGRGLQVGNNRIGTPPFARIYVRHITAWGNNQDKQQNTNTTCGEIIAVDAIAVEEYASIAQTSTSTACNRNPLYAYFVYGGDATTQFYQNWGYSAAGNNYGAANSVGFIYGPDNAFGASPGYANPVAPAAPDCGTFVSVPACMETMIANFQPTGTGVLSYGYQIPATAPIYDSLFPQWLCSVNLPSGLVTMGCLGLHLTQIN